MLKPIGFLFLMMLSSFGFSKATMNITADATATSFVVSLSANPTTGYQWSVIDYDRAHFELIKSEYVGASKPRIGQAGEMVFHFKYKVDVTLPSSTSILFSYSRFFEPGSGYKQRVNIVFKPKKAKSHLHS